MTSHCPRNDWNGVLENRKEKTEKNPRERVVMGKKSGPASLHQKRRVWNLPATYSDTEALPVASEGHKVYNWTTATLPPTEQAKRVVLSDRFVSYHHSSGREKKARNSQHCTSAVWTAGYRACIPTTAKSWWSRDVLESCLILTGMARSTRDFLKTTKMETNLIS